MYLSTTTLETLPQNEKSSWTFPLFRNVFLFNRIPDSSLWIKFSNGCWITSCWAWKWCQIARYWTRKILTSHWFAAITVGTTRLASIGAYFRYINRWQPCRLRSQRKLKVGEGIFINWNNLVLFSKSEYSLPKTLWGTWIYWTYVNKIRISAISPL